MTIKEIIVAQLKAIGADGLSNPETECGCLIGDLAPCECPDFANCVAGRKVVVPRRDPATDFETRVDMCWDVEPMEVKPRTPGRNLVRP